MIIFLKIIDGKFSFSEIYGTDPAPTSILFSLWTYDFTKEYEVGKDFYKMYFGLKADLYYRQKDILKGWCSRMAGAIKNYGKFKAPISFSALRSLASVFDAYAEDELMWRGMIIFAAIRLFEAKHNRLPNSLDELGDLVPKELFIDPFNGKRFVYRKKGADFDFYSMSRNGVDDSKKAAAPGLIKPIYEDMRTLFDALDIVFHRPDLTKKKK
jgi:hypothetical protein